ncbi:MAG: hypothetical protein WCP66_13070 [Methylococcales bacterium]
MFAKSIISMLALGLVIVGLLQFFSSGGYLTFVIGMALYFLITISGSVCKMMNK